MKDFMLIYKGGDPNWQEASAEQKQAMMARWGTWLGALGAKGKLVTGGSPLESSGRQLTRDGVVTDIASLELKELVTGYSIIKAESYEEAVTLAKDCPIFANTKGHASLEIRQILPM